MEKEYNYYASFKPHERIMDNLENMPNNKGYIVCGNWFFGKKPEEKGSPLVMFENDKGKQYIYEFHPNGKQLKYEKGKDNKKILLEDTVRKNPLQELITSIAWFNLKTGTLHS
jgi:hypothetical protein